MKTGLDELGGRKPRVQDEELAHCAFLVELGGQDCRTSFSPRLFAYRDYVAG